MRAHFGLPSVRGGASSSPSLLEFSVGSTADSRLSCTQRSSTSARRSRSSMRSPTSPSRASRCGTSRLSRRADTRRCLGSGASLPSFVVPCPSSSRPRRSRPRRTDTDSLEPLPALPSSPRPPRTPPLSSPRPTRLAPQLHHPERRRLLAAHQRACAEDAGGRVLERPVHASSFLLSFSPSLLRRAAVIPLPSCL